MSDDVEMMAEAICKTNPTTVDGTALNWEQVVHQRPDQATMYREAASNRIRAAEAMERLDQMAAKGLLR